MKNTLLGSQTLSMSVSDDDFAAVDSREELCQPAPSKKQYSEDKEKHKDREKYNKAL